MSGRLWIHDVPGRVVTGAYILHSGLEKWNGSSEQAEMVHGMAAGAYPFLSSMEAKRFLRLLAIAEVTTGALLWSPFVSDRMAGAALTGFSGGLLGMYARTPALHKAGSIWPEPAGIAVSKDVWMFGIGAGLLIGGRVRRRALRERHDEEASS